MLTGIDLTEVIDVVSEVDKGEEKTIFKISPLSSRIKARISKIAGMDGSNSIESLIEAFRFSVKNIVNLKDKKGQIIPFSTDEVMVGDVKKAVVSNDLIDMLPAETVIEIGAKVLSIGRLTEEEIKN